ncbi:hypothetical protein NQ318_012922 [Aromia moschata]|uniref:Potassium channel domain-containing protein n=1 Tax=Aromia moschata TaxID=1265417 RepID=A0AAV8XN30_9CUCU|nr:hypothetical protein NQ318_012922 [Aromia moschata]
MACGDAWEGGVGRGGYGHIAPKTTWGKVVTIFYAILGIPLMLLCLSNIGDIMATSFRFIYWRVCCYFCTKKPKKSKRARSRGSTRGVSRSEYGGSTRSRNNSFRRSVRTSTKSADSGFALSDMAPTSHSDTELRYQDEVCRRGPPLSRNRPNRLSEVTPPKTRQLQNSTSNRAPNSLPHPKSNSLDRKKSPRDLEIELDPVLLANTPILCNKYVVGKNDGFVAASPADKVYYINGPRKRRLGNASADRRAKSMPRNQHYLEPPRFPSPDPSERDDTESYRGGSRRKRHSGRRSRSPNPQMRASPRMMTPLGYGHPSKYLDDPESDDEYYDYYDDYYESGRIRTKPVPIWLCVLLVLSYILAGAYLFTYWENWPYLDAAYFCFITLTTIGFGDLVPAKGVSQNATVSIALCSLYLLFGISLLAMSFNLVQDEVISNVKSVAKTPRDHQERLGGF